MEANEYDLVVIGSGPAGQKGALNYLQDIQDIAACGVVGWKIHRTRFLP